MSGEHFQVLVIGGGHAGCEAALAAARMGRRTLLLTHKIDALGQMSCNPAIGGIGKSHLVKEVDAMGGVMALAADRAGIHFRVLNSRKGAAVRATRAQTDRRLYKEAVGSAMLAQPNLRVLAHAVADLRIEGGRVAGARTQSGVDFSADTVVLTTGTFLSGMMHMGGETRPGGRAGCEASIDLAGRLKELMPGVGRLKTGTPPRIDKRSVDFSVLTPQPGDVPRPVMSFVGDRSMHPEQRLCHIARTNERTHEIVRANLHESPMYGGRIEGSGPRYCPSIEDKVVRFAERDSHQIFVEPEGLDADEIYPNGISTGLSAATQLKMVRTVRGFEHARITRPGYAIEYDFFDPRGLHPWLETREVRGLFFAGQINGTTGYEEAAAQGLLAGVNAALRSKDEPHWYPLRHEAYIGVLVDDLCVNGVDEPYRMFTSRAEYRLLLREDNADMRLSAKARQLGLLDDERWRAFEAKRDGVAGELRRLRSTTLTPDSPAAATLAETLPEPLQHPLRLDELLRRPQLDYSHLRSAGVGADLPTEVVRGVVNEIKYAGYLQRQRQEIARLHQHETTPLPDDLDYARVPGLSEEIRQKLARRRPVTLGQAKRCSGVTPAALSALLVHLRARREGQRAL